MHPDFVSLKDICPNILIEASYATTENFTGEIVQGYKAKKAFLHKGPAGGLIHAQKVANTMGLTLKIFDGYRPAKAVAFFLEWAHRPETKIEIKNLFYPTHSRLELFEIGYLARRSSHSRGSAVDLTLTELVTGKDLDMGSMFDYFDTLSHTDSPRVSEEQKKNRELLKQLMNGAGFKNYDKEWWHYTFRAEPFPDQYFDFDIE